MKLRLLLLVCLASCTVEALAEIYKYVDKDGHVTYSSTPIKGGKKLHLPPLPTMPAPPKPKQQTRSQNDEDMHIDRATQAQRDDARRQILEDELAAEQKALEEARLRLQEARDTPEVYKNAEGKTFRNVARYEEKVRAAEEEVRNHESNIQALQTELSNLK